MHGAAFFLFQAGRGTRNFFWGAVLKIFRAGANIFTGAGAGRGEAGRASLQLMVLNLLGTKSKAESRQKKKRWNLYASNKVYFLLGEPSNVMEHLNDKIGPSFYLHQELS